MRWSPILLVLAAAASAAIPFHADHSSALQSSAVAQGWAGTPPSPGAPLEPRAPATVKEGEIWIPPLPAMESVAPPAGWVTSGPDVPPMPLTLLRLPRTNITRAKFPAIDFHVHARELTTPAAYQSLVKLMDSIGMGAIANMNGGTGQALDAALKAGEAYRNRVATFVTFDPDGINEPGWSQRFAAEMERGFNAGALGLKVHKTLGQVVKNPDGSFIQADDPRLDSIWAMAAKHGKPVMIHISDSIGRFYPIGPKNERYEAGLWRRPGDTSENLFRDGPRPEVIEKARENMHRKHPKTRFVNAHMAMLYYDPPKLAAFLDTYPNADVEISATLQDLGRAPRLWREFIIKYQDRILMGSDGSPSRGADEFWIPHWRYLETYDEYFYHPAQIRTPGGSPGHGRWNISGIGLPDAVLRKIYYQNALRHLPSLRASIERQLAARAPVAPGMPTAQAVPRKGDWPMYGRDPAGTRYSPLDQINTKNVAQLERAWVYHTKERGRAFETTPIVVDNVLYFSTQNQTIVALEPETGREIWRFDPKSNTREHRGVSYWPGDQKTPPRILFGTGDGRLIALDAKTGTLVTSFGDNGAVDLKAGITDKFPRAPYAITSPPAIYRDVVIVGPATQEGPTFGPSGDPRAYDVRTGKLLWRFHTVPQPGEPGSDTWGPDGWKDRSGPSAWGPATIDTERGMVFLPIGNPADSFYGADRKGTNLYSNSVVALDALTGKLRWYYQVVHHDIWDYDLAAPPALVDVRRDGKVIPAVAQITKMGLLFILDRLTGRPVFGVEERPSPKADTPGEASWPTQPFPLKPPPLARNSMTRADLTRRTPEATRFCAEWFDRLRHQGPYTPFGTTPSLLFPGTMGGGNWGGVSFDPTLGYIFVNTSSLGGTGQMVPAKPDEGRMPWRNEAGYTRFIDEDGFPCQQPPWGELIAVNASGDIAWRVPLGSYDAIEAQGMKNAGAANMGGSIVTAGGLVFIGATTDSKFRAFDSRTGKELWVTKLDATADAVPITYQGRNGKQYVVVAAGGTNRFRMLAKTADETADTLIAFALATP